MFDFVRLPNSIELNPGIEFVRLSSTLERSIDYAGHLYKVHKVVVVERLNCKEGLFMYVS